MYSIYKKIFINTLTINQVKGIVMQRLRPLFLIGTLLFIALNGRAQVKIGGYPSLSADNPDIHGVIFSKAGNQLSYPEMTLGSTEALALSFDDFDARLKNYSYTYIRCDQNWQPVLQSSFDYIQGFTDMRIRDAKFSSISRTRYVHYAATLPTSESQIKKSGNYLLKVYLDGDTSKLAFERRMLVVAPKVSVAASVVRPSGQSPTGDQQKLNLSISVNRLRLQNPRDQIKVVVLQNYRWDNAVHELQPAFMRGTTYEYNSERDLLFAAGKEFRWADLKSFRFQSDRVAGVSVSDGKPAGYDVLLKTDPSRNESQYMPYVDYDGFYQIASTENIQVAYQGDYGLVRFSYKTATGQPYSGRDLYVLGQFNQYRKDDNSRLVYNPAKGLYEKTLLLKQGYYSYLYGTAESTNQPSKTDLTEGNYWETENKYTILVYYQSYTDRAPELVACTTVSSR
ncbi:DUF5103 domain-containing protein [Arachidicoccus ginsenosidivorans]